MKSINTTAHPLRRALTPILLAASLSVAGFGAAVAGDHGPRDPAARMAERLSLDDSQKASVEAIMERNRPAMEALRERGRTPGVAMKALDPKSADYSSKAQALADEAGTLTRDRVLQQTQMRAELAAVLTSEQLEKMEQRRARPSHEGWKGKGPRPDKDGAPKDAS